MVAPIGREVRIVALYAEVPSLACKRLCRECCGPIWQARAMGPYEAERIAALGLEPSAFAPKDFMACAMLDGATGLCRVYERRPMICRLWGVDESMPCPYGCVPERWLTTPEGRALLHESTEIV